MTDSDLIPIAFDVETSGFGDDAVITVAGFCHYSGEYLVLNTAGRENFEGLQLVNELQDHANEGVKLNVVTSERELLEFIVSFVDNQLDNYRHYLTAFRAEMWNGGFDIPVCRRRFLDHKISWPFDEFPYADTIGLVEFLGTDAHIDLVNIHEDAVGKKTYDPFENSEEAVRAFEDGEWLPLLKHQLAHVQRIHEIGRLAEKLLPETHFSITNQQPLGR